MGARIVRRIPNTAITDAFRDMVAHQHGGIGWARYKLLSIPVQDRQRNGVWYVSVITDRLRAVRGTRMRAICLFCAGERELGIRSI